MAVHSGEAIMRIRRLAIPGVLALAGVSIAALTLRGDKEPPTAAPLQAVTVAQVVQREIADRRVGRHGSIR